MAFLGEPTPASEDPSLAFSVGLTAEFLVEATQDSKDHTQAFLEDLEGSLPPPDMED